MLTVPKISRFACAAAFTIAALSMVSGLIGPPVSLLFAIFPLCVGIGILRRRPWSAYGFSVFLCVQMGLMVFFQIRSGGLSAAGRPVTASLMVTVLLTVLFYFAGRSLDAESSRKESAVPWILVCIALTAPLLFVQAFVVPTGAMEDTILRGDRVLVRYAPKPRFGRGDIIAFKYPVDRRQSFLKRIIGIPGDRIRISKKAVYRNGTVLSEPYAVHKTQFDDSYRDNFPSEPNTAFAEAASDMLHNHVTNGEVVVPERTYFVLGDNRDMSLDSRYWGFVPFDDVIGKPVLIYDSEEQSSEDVMAGNPTWPRRTRWKRLFKLL